VFHASSHPFRYSLVRYLFASATFLIFASAESNNSLLPPVRNETAARLNASDIGPPRRKSPYVGLPPFTASPLTAMPSAPCLRPSLSPLTAPPPPPTTRGLSPLNPAMILPLSPTNIIPSCSNS